VLNDQETGLFASHPEATGVLFFDENSARYRFSDLPNPDARRPLTLPEGVMDFSLSLPAAGE
jgi:hypothetical protein